MLYLASHCGPFDAYPDSAFALTLTTRRDQQAMPRWLKTPIPTQTPDAAPTDDTLLAAIEPSIGGRVILLFDRHPLFKSWQLALVKLLNA